MRPELDASSGVMRFISGFTSSSACFALVLPFFLGAFLGDVLAFRFALRVVATAGSSAGVSTKFWMDMTLLRLAERVTGMLKPSCLLAWRACRGRKTASMHWEEGQLRAGPYTGRVGTGLYHV